jgi:peptide deformylase
MIVTNREKLKQVSEEVPFGCDNSLSIFDMWAALDKTNGVGIANVQIGYADRIIIINTDKCKMVIINPELSEGKYPKLSKEGCLSVPNMQVKVKRFNHIVITGFDENWNPIKKKLKALSAFVAQHEVDHLNGITIADK